MATNFNCFVKTIYLNDLSPTSSQVGPPSLAPPPPLIPPRQVDSLADPAPSPGEAGGCGGSGSCHQPQGLDPTSLCFFYLCFLLLLLLLLLVLILQAVPPPRHSARMTCTEYSTPTLRSGMTGSSRTSSGDHPDIS